MFLAAIMLGWPLMTAGGRAAGVPAVIATSNANQISERIAADPPSAPIGLTAKAGDAQVTLSWTPPESDGGAAIVGYLIYQGTSPGHESSTPVPSSDITGCTHTATAGSCTVTALADGTAYYFMVAAENDLEAVGPMSNEASATPVAPIEPAAPTGLTAKAGDTQVTLSWAAPASNGGPPVASYDIYDGTTPDFQAATLAEDSPGTAATVPGLTDGTTYYFWVTAVNTVGQSPASNEASATPTAPVRQPDPAAPTGLTAKAGDTQVTLSWAAPAPNGGPPVTSYDIYDGTTPDFQAATLAEDSPGTAATVPGLTDGTTYYFWVTAVNTAGQSPPSNQASATPEASAQPPPGAPTGLTAKAGDTQVTLSWAAPAPDGGPPVTSYDIYDGTTPDFQAATLAENSPGTAATVPGLTDGTTYYFWVTAVNTSGQSPASNQASATPAAPSASPASNQASATPATTPASPASNQASATPATTPASPGSSQASATPATGQPDPGAPAGLTASPGDTQVTLSWAAPAPDGGPQVTGYDVYRATTADFKAATLAGTSANTSATVTGLTDGTTYYFWVTAVNTAGHESPSSAAVSARPETASGSVPKGLVAALAAIATVVVAGALTLAMRGRRVNSRSSRHVTPASDVRAVPGPRLPDAVNVRETGREPTHTVRFEPDRGTTTTMIKEKP